MDSRQKDTEGLGDAFGPRCYGLRFAPVLPEDGQELPLHIAIASQSTTF